MNKPYDPQMTRYPYCEQTDQHYLIVKKDDGTVFDENYPYVDKSFGFRFKRFWLKVAACTLGFLINRIKVLLVIKGKKNLRKNRKILNKGCVSVANHVHMWDFISIMTGVFPRIPYTISWDVDIRGENGALIRLNNGIPVPKGNIHASHAFTKSVDGLLQDGKWVHISAEGSMWEYYQPIRPFKKGAFSFAVRNNKPIVPMGFSYRKPKGLAKLFWKDPLLTLTFGEPIFPDTTLSVPQAIEKLCVQSHEAVCRLAGIEPSENIYPPIFKNNKRIDYYTTVYGVDKAVPPETQPEQAKAE